MCLLPVVALSLQLRSKLCKRWPEKISKLTLLCTNEAHPSSIPQKDCHWKSLSPSYHLAVLYSSKEWFLWNVLVRGPNLLLEIPGDLEMSPLWCRACFSCLFCRAIPMLQRLDFLRKKKIEVMWKEYWKIMGNYLSFVIVSLLLRVKRI